MMYEAEVTATEIKISGQSVLTSGSVKVDQVHFTFSPDWDGCARTAVFLSGSRTVAVVLDETNQCYIPKEVLTTANLSVLVGAYGVVGNITVIPTVYGMLGQVLRGVDQTADNSPEPTPTLMQQTLAQFAADKAITAADRQRCDQDAEATAADRQTVTAAVTAEGARQVDAVQTAGAAQVLAVQNKGAEVIAAVDAKKTAADQSAAEAQQSAADAALAKTQAQAAAGQTSLDVQSTAQDKTATAADRQAVEQAAIGINATVNEVKQDLIAPNAGSHNRYRGKYLGTAVTDDQYTAISNGTFTDLFVGDYWTIGGVNWVIAGFDYYANCGDTAVLGHHAVIVPATNLYNAKMNDSNVTTGAYVGSVMYTTNLASAKTTISGIFGTHLKTHRIILQNAMSNGYPSGMIWADSTVDLMSEVMVYGTHHFGAMGNGSTIPSEYMCEDSQLPLMAQNKASIHTRQDYWLRDAVSASDFALVGYVGACYYFGAGYSRGVRPAFCIS